MILKAILSNKAHPEYGQATIPFPIPDSEYDRTIGLLEDMEIGFPTAQDCQVDGLDSPYPILKRLAAQSVNVDELDFVGASSISLASASGESSLISLLLLPKSKPLRWVSIWLPFRRLDGFCNGEGGKFEAMAVKLGLSSIRDYINLTFCCQQATVIADFSDLEHVGKDHALTMSGGSMLSEEYDQVDGRMAALDLLQNHSGTITPYGVVYDNGMKLEPLYDGRHFPAYLYKPSLMVLEVDPDPAGTAAGYLYLPCPARQLQRTLLRARQDPAGFRLEVTIDELPTEVSSLVSPTRDSLDALNALCQAVEPLNTEERRKLEAVVLMTHPQCAGEVRQLAENLDQFEFAPDVQTLEDYGRFMIQESGHFEYDENLERFYDYRLYGEIHSREDGGVFTKLGYVAYHGSLTLEELMMDDPAELYQQEMGGMA